MAGSFAPLLLLVAGAVATPFENCEADLPAVGIDIEGCDAISPCIFVRGQSYSMNLTFIADHDIASLAGKLTVIAPGQPDEEQPLPGNVCDQVDGGCPLAAGSTNVYGIVFPVASTGFLSEFIAQLALIDDHDHTIVCVSVYGILTNADKKISAVL